MAASEPIQVGGYRIAKEFHRRKELQEAGMKLPNQTAYINAWAVRQGEESAVLKYFLTEAEAREWIEEQPSGGDSAD